MATSKRFFTVMADGAVAASGFVTESPTRVNNLAINTGAGIAVALGLDPIVAVSAGKTEGAAEFRPAKKDKVKDGEAAFKAVAV